MSYSLIFSAVASIGIFVGILGYYLARDWKNRKTGSADDYNSPLGKKGLIVDIIESEEENVYLYQVKVGGEFWKAQSSKRFNREDQCDIKKQDKLLLTIE